MTRHSKRLQSGFLSVLAIVVVTAVFITVVSLLKVLQEQYAAGGRSIQNEGAVLAAQAGVNATRAQLNLNASFAGFNTEQELYNSSTRGRATYTTTITTNADASKTVVSTGRVYTTTSGGTAVDTKRIQVVLYNKKEPVSSSMIVGSGGLWLGDRTGIVNLELLYVAGKLRMNSNSYIGEESKSTEVQVNNLACGTSTTWPQSCGSGSEPISMINPTPGKIYGTVCARDQISTTGIYPGNNPVGEGLKPDCAPSVNFVPTFDKKSFVESMTGTSSGYSCPLFGGTVTVPANVRINATQTFESRFGACTVVFEGNVYITGALNIARGIFASTTLKASNSVQTTPPIIVANDGVNIIATTTVSLFELNTYGTPVVMLDFGSTNAACSDSDTIPNPSQASCLTPAQAQASATLSTPAVFALPTVNIDVSGLVYYAYYSAFFVMPGATITFNAFGAQGATVGGGTVVVATNPVAPFGDFLFYSNWVVVEYKPLY